MPSEFSKTSENFYYATLNKNRMEDTVDGRILFNRGFYLGAQYAMRTSADLSPHIARFLEFVMWLTERAESDG